MLEEAILLYIFIVFVEALYLDSKLIIILTCNKIKKKAKNLALTCLKHTSKYSSFFIYLGKDKQNYAKHRKSTKKTNNTQT